MKSTIIDGVEYKPVSYTHLYMLCDRAKRNFDLKEIRKHGIEFFFSVWFFILAITPNFQMDMRRLRMRSSARISARAVRPKRDSYLMFAA